MKTPCLFVALLAFALVAGGCNQQSSSAGKADFVAQLTGGEQVPSVVTTASGTASFWLDSDGTKIRYKLMVTDLHNVTMAHLHLGAPGKNGPPVVWLYPSAPPAKKIDGPSNGVLSEGSINADNLVGPMAGKTIGDLLAAIKAHDIYVNVHTQEHRGGEIRGQLQ